jgi:hypothetical protein
MLHFHQNHYQPGWPIHTTPQPAATTTADPSEIAAHPTAPSGVRSGRKRRLNSPERRQAVAKAVKELQAKGVNPTRDAVSAILKNQGAGMRKAKLNELLAHSTRHARTRKVTEKEQAEAVAAAIEALRNDKKGISRKTVGDHLRNEQRIGIADYQLGKSSV